MRGLSAIRYIFFETLPAFLMGVVIFVGALTGVRAPGQPTTNATSKGSASAPTPNRDEPFMGPHKAYEYEDNVRGPTGNDLPK